MKRKPCIKKEGEENITMSSQNVRICLRNQEGTFENDELNESLHLQYYGFSHIDNLQAFKNLNTLFLNNNVIEQISNLESLLSLRTLNLSYNRIRVVENINHLHQLYTLDISSNLIEDIKEQNLEGLDNLHSLKLGSNRLTTFQGIRGIKALSKSLTFLELSNNELLEDNLQIYDGLLNQLSLVTALTIQNTLFSRSIPNFRKETICRMKQLLYLDDRPISVDERLLAEAWKSGGIVLEREVRNQIREKKIEKSNKIYQEIEERNKIVEDKRKRVYDKLTNRQSTELSKLLSLHHNSQEYEILSQEQKNILKLNIQDLETYLTLMKESVKLFDLDKELGDGKVQLPQMLIDRETETAIYVYNVSQEQIPLIINKYYPEQTRPVIAVNHQKPTETRWISAYDQLLHSTYEQCRGNLELLVPLFNIALYEYDSSISRKVKRFEVDELKLHMRQLTEEESRRKKTIQALDQLD